MSSYRPVIPSSEEKAVSSRTPAIKPIASAVAEVLELVRSSRDPSQLYTASRSRKKVAQFGGVIGYGKGKASNPTKVCSISFQEAYRPSIFDSCRLVVKPLSGVTSLKDHEAMQDNETRAMQRLGQPYQIIKVDKDERYMVMHHLGKTLVELITKADNGAVDTTELRRIYYPSDPTIWVGEVRAARNIASALANMHHHGVLHRDIKALNITIEWRPIEGEIANDSTLHFIDWDHSKTLPNEKTPTFTHHIATRRYRTPESEDRKPYGPSGDVYQVGLLLYMMATGCDFRHKLKDGVYQTHDEAWPAAEIELNNCYSPKSKSAITVPPGRFPERYIEIIKSCLRKDPKARPTAAQLADDLAELVMPPSYKPAPTAPFFYPAPTLAPAPPVLTAAMVLPSVPPPPVPKQHAPVVVKGTKIPCLKVKLPSSSGTISTTLASSLSYSPPSYPVAPPAPPGTALPLTRAILVAPAPDMSRKVVVRGEDPRRPVVGLFGLGP